MTYRLPIFLDLKDKPVLLIGGGEAAFEKLEKLIRVEARVHLIAKRIHTKTLELLTQHGLTWEERSFMPIDVHGRHLVISAVNHRETHGMIARMARSRGILVNTVDEPLHSDFFFGSQVDRGPLQLAISTQGLFPGLARSLRLWLESSLPEDMTEEFLDLVAIRQELKIQIPDPLTRMQALKHQLRIWHDQLKQQASGA